MTTTTQTTASSGAVGYTGCFTGDDLQDTDGHSFQDDHRRHGNRGILPDVEARPGWPASSSGSGTGTRGEPLQGGQVFNMAYLALSVLDLHDRRFSSAAVDVLKRPGMATGRVVWPGEQRGRPDGQRRRQRPLWTLPGFQVARTTGAAIMASSGARWMRHGTILLLNVRVQFYLYTSVLTLTALQRFGFCGGCTKNIPRPAESAFCSYRRRKISGCKIHQHCDTISPNKKRGLPHRVNDAGNISTTGKPKQVQRCSQLFYC